MMVKIVFVILLCWGVCLHGQRSDAGVTQIENCPIDCELGETCIDTEFVVGDDHLCTSSSTEYSCKSCNVHGGFYSAYSANVDSCNLACTPCPLGQYSEKGLWDGVTSLANTEFWCKPCMNHQYINYRCLSDNGDCNIDDGTTHEFNSMIPQFKLPRSRNFCTECPSGKYVMIRDYNSVPFAEQLSIEGPQWQGHENFCTDCTIMQESAKTCCKPGYNMQCCKHSYAQQSYEVTNTCCSPGYYYDYVAAQSHYSNENPYNNDLQLDMWAYCTRCPRHTYKDTVGMQACTPCPPGTFAEFLEGDDSDDYYEDVISRYISIDVCLYCELGKYLLTRIIDNGDAGLIHERFCEPCAIGKYKDDEKALECTDCAAGFTTISTGSTSIQHCSKKCGGCDEQHFRSGCYGSEKGKCLPCEECGVGETRVNCRHDAGFNDARGTCEKTELLSYTPFCTKNFTANDGQTFQMSVGLGGFSYTELFGVPDPTYVPDFQCREECVGVANDTSYCGGPYACGTKACSATFAQDGEDGYRTARGCPVSIFAEDEYSVKLLKTQQQCTDCSTCGQGGTHWELGDWGRGCANECSRLLCRAGEIYDFTDQQCKRCDELSSIQLCPSTQQAGLRNTDVSGHAVLLDRQGCRGSPAAFDLSVLAIDRYNANSTDPTYGECIVCEYTHFAQEHCTSNEYADTCHSCRKCVQHGLVDMTAVLWSKPGGGEERLPCQMPACSYGLTGLRGDGGVCVDACVDVQCDDAEFELPCSLPHNARCRPRWPVVADVRVPLGVVPHTVDVLGGPLQHNSFENALVEVGEEPKHRHVCVWNAMDIRDNIALPAGVSRTWRKPADSIDFVYGGTGTKFCAPIRNQQTPGAEEVDIRSVQWARDPAVQNYPLLPLQNTGQGTAQETAAESTASTYGQYMLTNTSASVVAYRRPDEITYDVNMASAYYSAVPIPDPPDGLAGDLFLAMDLQRAVRGDVAAQIAHIAHPSAGTETSALALLFTAWVRVLAASGTTRVQIQAEAASKAGVSGERLALPHERLWMDTNLVSFGVPDTSCGGMNHDHVSWSEVTLDLRWGQFYRFYELHAIGEKMFTVLHHLLQSGVDFGLWVSSRCAGCTMDSWSIPDITRGDYAEESDDFLVVGDGVIAHNTEEEENEGLLTVRSKMLTLYNLGVPEEDSPRYSLLNIGSVVQARAASCGVLVASERTVVCIDVQAQANAVDVRDMVVQQYGHNAVDQQELIAEVALLDVSVSGGNPGDDAMLLLLKSPSASGEAASARFTISLWHGNAAIPVRGADGGRPVTLAADGRVVQILMERNSALYVHTFVATVHEEAGGVRPSVLLSASSDMQILQDQTVQLSEPMLSTASVRAMPGDRTQDANSVVLVAQELSIDVVSKWGYVEQLIDMRQDGRGGTTFVCKPSVAWIDDDNFMVGLPCRGELWRGRSTAAALMLSTVPEASFLKGGYFMLHGRVWLRLGVMTVDDIDITASVQAAQCPQGYELIETDATPTVEGVLGVSCAWQCTHTGLVQDGQCEAFTTSRGECELYYDKVISLPYDSPKESLQVCRVLRNAAAPHTTAMLQRSATENAMFLFLARDVQEVRQMLGFRRVSGAELLSSPFPDPLPYISFTSFVMAQTEFVVSTSTAQSYVDALKKPTLQRQHPTLEGSELSPVTTSHATFGRKAHWTFANTRYETLTEALHVQASLSLPLEAPDWADNGADSDAASGVTSAQCALRVYLRAEAGGTVVSNASTVFIVVEAPDGGHVTVLGGAGSSAVDNVIGLPAHTRSDGTTCTRGVFTAEPAAAAGDVADVSWTLLDAGSQTSANSITGSGIELSVGSKIMEIFSDTVNTMSPLARHAYLAGFRPTHSDSDRMRVRTMLGKSARWHRVMQLLPASDVGRVSMLRVLAERVPSTEQNLGSSWPAQGCESQLVVGVDSMSGVPVLSELPAYVLPGNSAKLLLSIRLPVVLSSTEQDALTAVQRGNDLTDWARLYVRVLVGDVQLPQYVELVRVRLGLESLADALDEAHTPSLQSQALSTLGCTINLHDDLQGSACFFELPRTLAEGGNLFASFHFMRKSGAVAEELSESEKFELPVPLLQSALFVTVAPPQASMYSCGAASEYWDADRGLCVECQRNSDCEAGFFMPGCAALEGHVDVDSDSRSCQACDIPGLTDFTWTDSESACSFVCNTGFFKNSGGLCSPCTNLLETAQCVLGQRQEACTPEQDAACVACVPHTEHGIFLPNEDYADLACNTLCEAGYYRAIISGMTGCPCVQCRSMNDVKALLELERGPDEFYWFRACTGTSDLQAVLCSNIDFAVVPTQDGSLPGESCKYRCPAGEMVVYQDVNHSLHSDQEPSADQLLSAFALETVPSVVTRQQASCQACPLDGLLAGQPTTVFEWLDTDEECAWQCTSSYVLWKGGCYDCARTCAHGQYLDGEQCDECKSCTNTLPAANAAWTGAGVLGNSTSCPWQCNDNFFLNNGVCVPHSARPASCPQNQYWSAGTPLFDGLCLPCATCVGMQLVQECLADADAQCAPCADPIIDGVEQFTGDDCTVECVQGYVRDTRAGSSQACENCDGFLCPPGTQIAQEPTHCEDCITCDESLPSHATWVQGCDYTCDANRELARVSSAHSSSESSSAAATEYDADAAVASDAFVYACVPETSGVVAVMSSQTARIRDIVCTADHYLDNEYNCVPCTVRTPPAAQVHKSWQWTTHSCVWECVPLRLRYIDKLGQVHCLLWDQYKDAVLSRGAEWERKFTTIQHVVEHVNLLELCAFVLVVVVSVVYQVFV